MPGVEGALLPLQSPHDVAVVEEGGGGSAATALQTTKNVPKIGKMVG